MPGLADLLGSSASSTVLLPFPVIAAPTTAPSNFGQYANSTIASDTSPTGGVSAGWAGTTTLLYRVRYVGRQGYSAPGPASTGNAVLATNNVSRMFTMPAASTDPNVFGILIERSKDAGATWKPIYSDDANTYTAVNGAPTYDDMVPDANLGAALPIAGDASAGATIQPQGLAYIGPANVLWGDAVVPQVPDHPYYLQKVLLARPDGSILTLVSPLYLIGS